MANGCHPMWQPRGMLRATRLKLSRCSSAFVCENLTMRRRSFDTGWYHHGRSADSGSPFPDGMARLASKPIRQPVCLIRKESPLVH